MNRWLVSFSLNCGIRTWVVGWAIVGCILIGGCAPLAISQRAWVATWAAAPAADTTVFGDQTLRLVAKVTRGGDTVRIRLSNAFGREPLRIAAAGIGVQGLGASLVAGTSRALRFGGGDAIAIPPGAVVVSDPVSLRMEAGSSLAVSLRLVRAAAPSTVHFFASQTSYAAPAAEVAGEDGNPFTTKLLSWPYLERIEVLASTPAPVVVAFGDSITDGFKSSLDANTRWPDVLARRLALAGKRMSVVNAGISGNRIWHDAPAEIARLGPNGLSRFDRDVLSVSGVTHVVVLLGINDIGLPGARNLPGEAVTSEQVIAGLQQFAERAHARGVKLIAGTLMPFDGSTTPGYYSAANEAKRQAVNAWIRGANGVLDGVIDFDRATRDPAQPSRLQPAFDSGDHLHPNDAGYRAMGEAVDLGLFD